MSTGNYPNDPSSDAVTGTAKVLYDTTFSTRQKLAYVPNSPGFTGVDSFYYLFEIVGQNGENDIVRRSTMGKITINVVKNCASGTTTTTTTTTGTASSATTANNNSSL